MSGGLEGIVPRWEWRTFGPRLGTAEALLAALEPTHVRDSDEIYVLALGREASIKARDSVMDVKRLERVNAEGLEQWLPVAKATYPLRVEGVREAIAALGAEVARRCSATSTRSSSCSTRSSGRARSSWQWRCTSIACTTWSTAA